jgi:hypothetical protein
MTKRATSSPTNYIINKRPNNMTTTNANKTQLVAPVDLLAELLRSTDAVFEQIGPMLAEQNASEPVKTTFAALQTMITTCKATVDQLKLQQEVDLAHEMERKRSVVLIGIPESQKEEPVERAREDNAKVEHVLNLLGVQTLPSAVYRLGRPKNPASSGLPRLIKCVLPAQTFQWQMLGGWKKKRDELKAKEGFGRLIIRPSLTRAQLDQQREERKQQWMTRNGNSQSTHQNNFFNPTPSLLHNQSKNA